MGRVPNPKILIVLIFTKFCSVSYVFQSEDGAKRSNRLGTQASE